MKLPRHQAIAARLREQAAPPFVAATAGDRTPDVRIQVAAPLPHQVDPLNDPARNKVFRWGRRTGKTRIDVRAALTGHGPLIDAIDRDGHAVRRPMHRGILSPDALDVAWICPTYKQADPLWLEEVLPRFEGVPHCQIDRTDKWVRVEGMGRLFVRTWENAGTMRGQGANLVGVIFDEAAHMDCRTMWTEFVLYALLDNIGWSIWSSTTNADLDGNPEQIAPSFFNVICREIEQGVRDPAEWKAWYATAHDNPKIDQSALGTVIEEAMRSGGQRRVDQEVYALLLDPGSGLAFPSWRRAVHVRDVDIDEGWGCVGTLDWGSADPGAFYLLLSGPGGQLALRNEVYFNGPPRPDWEARMTAVQVGQYVAHRMAAFERRYRIRPSFISADSAMWAITGVGETIAGKFQEGLESAAYDDGTLVYGRDAPQLVQTPKGPGSRATRKELLTEALSWTEDPAQKGRPTVEGWPLLAVGTDCPHFARIIPVLANDKHDPEKVADKDDHVFDSATYGLHTLVPEYDDAVAQTRAEERARAHLDPLSKTEAAHFEALAKRAQTSMRRGRRQR